MRAGLAVKRTAREAWDAIRLMRMGADRVKEANAEKLRQDFADITFKPGELVEDFALRINTLANELRVLGDPVTEKEVVKKMLHEVPERLESVAISMETLLDLNTLSLEEATGHLRAVERRKKKVSGGKDGAGRLLLTEEEWTARMKKHDGSSSGAGSGGRERRNGGKPPRGRGHDGGKASASRAGPTDICDYCGKKGHWAAECRKKKRDQAQAFVAQEEEEDQALLMAHAVILHTDFPSCAQAPPPPPERVVCSYCGKQGHSVTDCHKRRGTDLPPSAQAPPPPPSEGGIVVNEQEVHADLGPREEGDDHLWVLDTGATNHMTGCRDAFAELDSKVCGNVWFGDGSVVEIEGRGSIVFVCKNGEHRALTGVYYIPKLKANIISLGQLEETGCRVVLDSGVLTIHDPSRRLLAKVTRSPARLYHLRLNIGRPVCLSARASEQAWLWHTRFGHLGFSSLKRMAAQQMVRGLPLLDQVDQVCDGCLIGKQRRASFPA